jgi:hypothetical protein
VEAERAMRQAAADLNTLQQAAGESGAALAAWQQARQSVTLTLTHLEALRRLFFSVIDHLQETVHRQIDLADRTEETAVLAETQTREEIARRIGPLSPEQDALAETTASIAEVLRQQAEQAAEAARDPQSPPQPADTRHAQADGERLRQAAEHVAGAQPRMAQASEGMSAAPPPFETIRGAQQQAVEELTRALALLQPPPSEQARQDPQQPQDQAGEQQASEENEAGEEDARPQPSPSDPGQLLQGVRDREAQRREQRARQQHRGYEPVEKDW